MFCNFYFAKIHETAEKSTIAKAKEKIQTALESIKFYEYFNERTK
jgi:hypothetical protein